MSYKLLIEAVESFLSAESEAESHVASKREPAKALHRLAAAKARLREAHQLCAMAPLIERILVPVDDSQQALWAAEIAGRLAEELSAQVELLHVIKMPTSTGPEVLWEARIEATLSKGGEQLLNNAEQNIPKGVKVKRSLRKGYAGDEIVAVARNGNADLIIMGTHGRGRLAEFVLGSTAEAVIRNATCPVLTVAHPINHPDSEPKSAAAGSSVGK